MDVLAELDLQLLHFIVMEILLDQVALSLHSSPHVRGNIRNHPGNKELDQERNVLWSRKQVCFSSAISWQTLYTSSRYQSLIKWTIDIENTN